MHRFHLIILLLAASHIVLGDLAFGIQRLGSVMMGLIVVFVMGLVMMMMVMVTVALMVFFLGFFDRVFEVRSHGTPFSLMLLPLPLQSPALFS